MCPIFKNIDSHGTKDIIGEHMFDYCTQNSIPAKKSRKLIGSMKGDKILLYTPLLKWYLEHGKEVKFSPALALTASLCYGGEGVGGGSPWLCRWAKISAGPSMVHSNVIEKNKLLAVKLIF